MKLISTLLFPASLLLAGCTADRIPGTDPDMPVEIPTVPLIVESATMNAQVATRATTTLNSGSIGIFLSGTGYTAISNRQYDYSASAWTPNGGAANAILLGGSTASVCAYHPWQATFTNSTAIPLTSQVMDNTNKDISFALNRGMDGSSTGSSTIFSMTRAYAKVTFVFQRNNYPGTCQVQKVELKNLLPSATLNIGTGVYSTATGVANSSVSQIKNVTVPATSTVAWGSDILLVPCTPASTGITIVITVDGKTMTTTIPTGSYTPVKGEYKIITITVRGTGIIPTSVTTEDWANGNLGPFIPAP